MKAIFKDYLFNHGILVNEASEKSDAAFESRFALAKLFNIRITEGQDLVTTEMICYAGEQLGQNVSEPFYRGFPESVRKLTSEQKLFDQMLHYAHTYGMGAFSEQGHSMLEDFIKRDVFNEKCEIRDFSVITEEAAVVKLAEYVGNLLAGTRPVNDNQYEFICEYICEYDYQVKNCASKNMAIKLLLEFRNVHYADFIAMSDVIKLVDEMNYRLYDNENIRALNLKNQDRKFITGVINHLFHAGTCDLRYCFEKKAVWNGLLHHIHYHPINEIAAQFVQCMRGKENFSVYAEFERAMTANDIREAVMALKKGKGSGAVLRNMNYILSRCESVEDVQFVMEHIESSNGIVLIQLLMEYATYRADATRRTFKFTRHNKLVVHEETDAEMLARQSKISEKTVALLCEAIKNNLRKVYVGKLGKIYIDPAMKNIALPMQEASSSSGYGILPRGSRLHIEEGKKVRAFTYWEKVHDIDLSVIGIRADGSQIEFSWRSMWNRQSDAIIYSGDETSGYNGGSEYFDLDISRFRVKYPDVEYLVFCDNVYSGTTFDKCICRAGYMLRDVKDSGQVYEPKTVKTSFTIDCNSRFAYLFAIDLAANDFIWLNVDRESSAAVAGTTRFGFLMAYFDVTSVMNMYEFFSMLGDEIVNDVADAEIIVTDRTVESAEGVEVIRSCDTERILALMN
ncbi:hypothetical protein [Bariatricus sp. HCP28S3_D3]|uniref:hypothetical protein n=1 Tax=Bariatricus sp. HCP28S3_D3 TaxID=3438901 RepID=UPI003F89A79E